MERAATVISGGEKPKKRKKKRKKKPYEWEEAIDRLSKYYSVTWETVTSWNILDFMHKADFVKYEADKKKEEQDRIRFKRR